MSPERWQRIEPLYYDALERPAHERLAWLAEACAGDAELKREVEVLLAANDSASGFLTTQALHLAAHSLAADGKATRRLSAAVGQRLSHYQVLSRIGAGGMGEVFLARDTSLDRHVALKLLPVNFTQDPERLQRFIREAKAASALNHPNIITIYEIGVVSEDDSQTHFIVTEYIEGVTLRAWQPDEDQRLSQTIELGIQIASALDAAHQAGIVHRDIKPENLMVRPDGLVKVLDFGLAKLIAAHNSDADQIDTGAQTTPAEMHTTPGTILGTLRYMSPEQARGRALDGRTDIFSLGVVLYELLTRQPLFEGESGADLVAAILHKEPAPLSNYLPEAPAELERILRKALAKDAQQRYQTARDLQLDLQTLKQELEFSARTASGDAARQPAKPNRSNQTVTNQATVPLTDEPLPVSQTGRPQIKLSDKLRRQPALLFAVVLVFGGLAWALYRFGLANRAAATRFQQIQIARLTTEDGVGSVAISPDGKYISYVVIGNGMRSLWTKNLISESRVQIVPPQAATLMVPSTFTPDGGFVYYLAQDSQYPLGALYQVPVLGGRSRRLLTDLRAAALSSDGRQLAVLRYQPDLNEHQLWLTKADGTDERKLIARRSPERFSEQQGAAWSPDGKWLALGYGSQAGGEQMTLALVSVADGTLKELTTQRWMWVGRVAWWHDGSGVVLLGQEKWLSPIQIWQVAYPTGATHRISHDLHSYGGFSLSLTADNQALVSTQNSITSNIWVAPATGAPAHVVTPRKNIQDGQYGLSWTPDGHVVFDSNVDDKHRIWLMKADGTEAQPLTDGAHEDIGPLVTPDGRHIVFLSFRRKNSQLWRMEIDGSHAQPLTENHVVVSYAISPDGQWVFYRPFEGGLWKVPLTGGTPVKWLDRPALYSGQCAPDGKRMALLERDETTKRLKFTVLEMPGEKLAATILLPATAAEIFHWTPDSQALVYVNTLGEASNLWRQPINGGPARQLTAFTSDPIYEFAFARDGRQLAIARGAASRDAVMITAVR